jgi:hypothetical protein
VETSAGKISMITELFIHGMLCKCCQYDEVENGDGTYSKEIRHEINCEGKIKARELLGYPNE